MTTLVIEPQTTTLVIESTEQAVQVGNETQVVVVGVSGPQGPPGPEGPPGGGASVHDFLGALHELEGLTAGHVLRATSATTADFEDIADTYALVHGHPYEPTGTAAAAIIAHEGLANPHPTYLTQAEGDGFYARLNAANTFTEDNHFRVLDVVYDANNDGEPGGITGQGFGDHVEGFTVLAVRGRGTQAAPTNVQEDDFLFTLGVAVWNDDDYSSSGAIRFHADSSTNGAAVPARLEFWTADEDDMLQRLQIDSAGNVWFVGTSGVTPLLDTRLRRASAGVLQADNAFRVVGSADVEQFTVTANAAQAGAVAAVKHSNGNPAFAVYSIAGQVVGQVLGDTSVATVSTISYGNTTSGSTFNFAKGRGTQSVPLDIASGDVMLLLQAQGIFSGGFRAAATITATVDGTPSGTRVPGRWSFATGTAAVDATERMRIDSIGDMYRLGAATTIYALRNRAAIGDANDLFHIRQDGLMEWGAGGASVVDVTFKRDAAASLVLTGRLTAERASAAGGTFQSRVIGDSVARLAVLAGGGLLWGDGSAAGDVALGRTAANVLATADQFRAADGVQTKYLSGAGKASVVDGDFTATPTDGTTAVVRNTTDGKVRWFMRANGAWVGVEAS